MKISPFSVASCILCFEGESNERVKQLAMKFGIKYISGNSSLHWSLAWIGENPKLTSAHT